MGDFTIEFYEWLTGDPDDVPGAFQRGFLFAVVPVEHEELHIIHTRCIVADCMAPRYAVPDGVQVSGSNRGINRHQWQYDELERALQDPQSEHAQVFTELKRLLSIRQQQAAFHPNATQFTLHLGSALFGFWRQSIDRRQSIFCISNISREPQVLHLTDINLIEFDQWSDLITGEDCTGDSVELAPYRSVWITNRRNHSSSLRIG